jgi:hypothetical protein
MLAQNVALSEWRGENGQKQHTYEYPWVHDLVRVWINVVNFESRISAY